MIRMRQGLTAVASVLTLLMLCGIGGCKKEAGWKSHQFEEKTMRPKAHDVQIPATLWEKIEALSSGAGEKAAEKPKEGGHEGGGSSRGSESAAQRPPTSFDSVKVYLVERNKGILKSGDMALTFPNGGGELDLSDFVEPKRGSFHVVFEFLPEIENAQIKIFYLSQAVSRKIGSDTVGAGCGTFMDITQAAQTAAKGDGFLVNTSEQRHVSALAGTYVFASMHEGKLHLSSLIIRDSQNRALQCRR